ncbi:MAG TPA: hypothetical protein VGX76_13330, partial [Pirellulales bacterium]|nr:hypothetical protein [Pirellulales bacterium]
SGPTSKSNFRIGGLLCKIHLAGVAEERALAGSSHRFVVLTSSFHQNDPPFTSGKAGFSLRRPLPNPSGWKA